LLYIGLQFVHAIKTVLSDKIDKQVNNRRNGKIEYKINLNIE